MNPPSKAFIELEREDRTKLWRGKFAEPSDVVPVYLGGVTPGSICRLWFMPNQSRFVVLGLDGNVVKIAHAEGQLCGLTSDALAVVVSPPPTGFRPVIQRIKNFERQLVTDAWCGRPTD